MTIDHWLMHGFEGLTGARALFLNCTHATLMSDYLSLLPNRTVFEIPELVKPDTEVLSVCRSLKTAGYRFALDDFESWENIDGFLALADFIKVDFQHIARRERACMLRDLKLTDATLIADRIESEEDFSQAVAEGFGLFQGYWVGESLSDDANHTVALDPMKCTCILGALEESVFSEEALVELIRLERGIECRLLRRANWATPASVVIHSTRDALGVVGRADLEKIVTLAMTAAQEEGIYTAQRAATNHFGSDALVRWMEMGAQTPRRYNTGRAAH
jgi:EAL and modified HD-GYP domain-containing signal transduction protein